MNKGDLVIFTYEDFMSEELTSGVGRITHVSKKNLFYVEDVNSRHYRPLLIDTVYTKDKIEPLPRLLRALFK